jgi:hypothetical protein
MADIRRVHRTAKSSLNTNNEQDNYNYTTSSSSTKFLDSNENSSSKKSKKSSHVALVEDSSSLAGLSSSRKSKKPDVASFKTSRAIVPSPPDYSYNNNNFSNKYYDKLDPDDLANTLKPRASNKNSHSSRTKVRASFSKSLSRSKKLAFKNKKKLFLN